MLTDVLLISVAIATSTFAGITGLGGGMLLLASLPSFLPVHALIPVHGVAQLASNFSRTLLALPSVTWQHLPSFLLGSLLGICVAGVFLSQVDAKWLPVLIGLYILFHLWWPAFKRVMTRFENFFIIGAIQTGLNPVVGATGPLTTTLVIAKLKTREAIVSTNAIMMSFTHMMKIALFIATGFEYLTYLRELILLSAGAIIGSFVGTRVRRKIDGDKFITILKALLSLLALRMIALTILEIV